MCIITVQCKRIFWKFFGLYCAQSVIVVKCLIITVWNLSKLGDGETSLCPNNVCDIDRKLLGFIYADICYWVWCACESMELWRYINISITIIIIILKFVKLLWCTSWSNVSVLGSLWRSCIDMVWCVLVNEASLLAFFEMLDNWWWMCLYVCV